MSLAVLIALGLRKSAPCVSDPFLVGLSCIRRQFVERVHWTIAIFHPRMLVPIAK